MNYIRERLLSNREGKIVFWGSIIHALLFASSLTLLTEKAWYSFILFMGAFMPLFLVLMYLKLGGFSKSYESSDFNAVILGVIAIIPLITTASDFF